MKNIGSDKGAYNTNPAPTHEIHPGGANRLAALVDDYVLTMQHAIRQELTAELKQRAIDEAGVLPPLSPLEMFDYLIDTDSEFLNWVFPFCAFKLTPKNLGYLHARIISDYRKSLELAVPSGDLENLTTSDLEIVK